MSDSSAAGGTHPITGTLLDHVREERRESDEDLYRQFEIDRRIIDALTSSSRG